MRIAFLSTLLSVLSGTMFGQAGGGTITGTISDQVGAIIVGAEIEATNTQTGASYAAQSTNTGNYTISQLPVGTYDLAVRVQGFKTYFHSNLILQAAATVREDVTLQVGNASDSVTVVCPSLAVKHGNRGPGP